MPNKFDLKLTRGAIQLNRRWEPGPDERLRPPMGGGGTRAGLPGPSTAGRVQTTWSAKSRRRMRFDFGALPWEMLGRRPVMITLTYPGEWELWVPDSREFVRHREALKERWRRRYGPLVGVWVTEFQRRGAPHLHLYVGLPDSVSDKEYLGLQQRTMRRRQKERRMGSYAARGSLRAPTGEFAMWLRTAWWEVVGSELAVHHGRGVDIATAFYSELAEATANRVRVAEYFWRESGKWAQKEPPEGFGSLRFYGRWGQKQGFNPVVTTEELDERVGLELRRMLRRMMRGKMREAARRSGRPVRRNAGRSRGRDGLTVFGVDGTVVGPRLVECAIQIAIEKAARPERAVEVRAMRLRPELLRAFSEIEVDPDPVRDPADDTPDGLFWVDPQEAAVHAWLDEQERHEDEIEAAVERWHETQRREHRKAEVREAQPRRGPRSTRGGSADGQRRAG